ncbi:DUF2169 family type VI secretion system accessory protein [Azohydromonas caseinilytica]|uniref:DUF2169 domain-containing protein n=1 Tax=Azohydromonas caseinilytica TaxID=2728836 RepID=A0A848FAG7_9BURK|nr:DUF2169 domain-containing protein [Azohydromonas caseinilytica]NML16534.1 DUF2169 domain-containing protein [Azohydromonas caseinilytica]
MELLNATRMVAGYTMGLEPSGRELLVVVVKGTFVLPKPGEAVRLHDTQLPLVMADTFSGEPGFSAPVQEVDFAPRKPACDVLLNGSAYAPGGRPVARVPVGLRVGTMHKHFEVVGDRVWEARLAEVRPSAPKPFVRQPISYDVAFGGADRESEDPAEHDAYLPNPVGRGWRKHLKNAWVDGRPLPSTEAPGEPVTWPAGRYRPMAFGPLGRGWPARARYAGTYDDHWLAEVFPFLPADFDERYYQAAPADQQLPVPKAPLDVTLVNLTPDGLRSFVLPHFEAPVHVFPRRGAREDLTATLDTLVFEPDQERFTMSWRVARPLRKNMFELAQVMVGKKGREWWQRHDEHQIMLPLGSRT